MDKRTVLIVAGAVIGLGLLVWLIVWFVTPRSDRLTVKEFSWVREIVIEEEVYYEGEGWDLPSGAREDYSTEEIYDYDDDGDPIYKRYYFYYWYEWETVEIITTEGIDKHPYWDEDFVLYAGERVGRRNERYLVTALNVKGELKTYSFSLDEWEYLELDKTYRVNTYVSGYAELVQSRGQK